MQIPVSMSAKAQARIATKVKNDIREMTRKILAERAAKGDESARKALAAMG